MANSTLPIIYFNLSGELFYVIRQRLAAQNIPKDKADKVLQDIVGAMFRDSLVDEILKPQNIYTKEALQAVYEKLVHSSIMRLNITSLNKLFDLMFMVFKFQAVNCIYPEDILLVTLNHLDAIKECSALTPELRRRVETVIRTVIDKYLKLIHLEFERVYEIIMNFLKDYNTKVSVLMRFGLQNSTGELIAPDAEKKHKGTLALIDINASFQILGETVKQKWLDSLPENWREVNGDRMLELGKDIRAEENWEFYPMNLISLKKKNQGIY